MPHELRQLPNLSHETLGTLLVGAGLSVLAIVGFALYLRWRHGRGKKAGDTRRQPRSSRGKRRPLPASLDPGREAMTVEQGVALALVGVGVVGGLAFLIFGDAPMRPRGQGISRPDDAQALALGRKVYEARCAACHGARLEGQANWRERGADGRLPAPPHDAGGHTWHHPDDTLFRITKFGVAKVANMKEYATAMPIYEGVLSDEEIVAVLSWIKSQWPADIRARHDQVNQQARPAP